MKQLFMLVLALVGACSAAHAAQPPDGAPASGLAFHAPFTLRLHVDKEHYYEQKITQKIPYVDDNTVYLFPGDAFGLKLTVANGEVQAVSYQEKKEGADVELEFRQMINKDGSAQMLLVLKSNIKQRLYIDAVMVVPVGKKGSYQTDLLPLEPGHAGYESWPHPIVQLVLSRLRFAPDAHADAPKTQKPGERAD